MAIIKPEQLQSGSYSISGSFSGSFQGDGSQLNNVTASYLNPLTQDVTITGSLNLLSSSISVVDYIDFNNTGITPPPDIEGRIYWDEDNGTLSLGMHGGQVVQQVGLEEYFYVKNQTGDTIPNGSVVRAAGTLGASGRILGDLMIADGSVTYYFTLGIATEDIVNGDDGYVTQFGAVRGINTTGTAVSESWNDGDVLWASPTVLGGLTKFEPDSPNLKIQMAIVIRAASNGTLFVRPDLSGFLTDLHNVNDFTTTSSFGNLLVKSGSTWIDSYQLTGSYGLTGSIEGGEFTGSFSGNGANITGIISSSYALTASYAEVAGAGAGFPFSGSAIITGSLLISSSTNQQLTLQGSGSDQPIFTVQGSSGELFSITDNLSGSLFAVNNISGLPIFEVFSDDKIIQGDYVAPMLTTTVKNTVSSIGAFTVYELPTSSYDGAFFEYVAKSGSDARAGQIMSLWSGSQVNFTETTTTDFGDTSGLSFIVTVTGSNFALTGSVTTANWTIKTIVRSI